MGHGLGSARDFGHQPEEVGLSDEELRLNAELLGGQPVEENLGQDDPVEDAIRNPFDDGEVGEYLGGETVEGTSDEMAELMAYLQYAAQSQYVVTPMDLCALKNEGILSVAEARTYLEAKGVIGG